MKMFREMTFDERVAWARGHILVAVGEGKYQDAVWLVCQQFALHQTVEGQRVHHYWRGPGKRGALCGQKGGVIHDELNHVDAGGTGCRRCLTLARTQNERRAAKRRRSR